MPRGIKSKPVVTPKVQKPEPIAKVKEVKEIAHVREEKKEEIKKDVLREVEPVGVQVPKVQKLDPLGPGQAYFEAPDGTVLVGEADKAQLWYRAGNGGKGMFINQKR